MFGNAEILRLRSGSVPSRAEGMTVLDGRDGENFTRAGLPGAQPSIIANKANMRRFGPKNEGRGGNKANVRGEIAFPAVARQACQAWCHCRNAQGAEDDKQTQFAAG